MKICVITPYFQTRDAWLRQAHDSVRAQTIPARHILVCDGSVAAEIPAFAGTHLILGRNYRDYGNTPRLIGCYKAIGENADAIAFLDADNWYQDDHLEKLLEFAQNNKLDACSSGRSLHREDGTFLANCPIVNGRPHIDTSCLLVMRPAFEHLIVWSLFSQEVAAVIDQEVWMHMKSRGVNAGFLDRPSVRYRTRHASHYRIAGVTPPPDAISRNDLNGDHYQ